MKALAGVNGWGYKDLTYEYIYRYISKYMGKPMTIQPEDNSRLESLKKSLRARSKVEVLRMALSALEDEIRQKERRERLVRAARLVARERERVNREFQKHSRLRRIDD